MALLRHVHESNVMTTFRAILSRRAVGYVWFYACTPQSPLPGTRPSCHPCLARFMTASKHSPRNKIISDANKHVGATRGSGYLLVDLTGSLNLMDPGVKQ